LIIFTPRIKFTFELRLGAALSWKGHDLASIRVRGQFSGPGRWEISGSASFTLLLWEVEVGFSEAWGDAPAIELTDGAVLPEIIAALSSKDAWHATLPGGPTSATFRQIGDQEAVMVHPLGRLEGRQKVVPFGLTIEKVRAIRPTDATRFDIGEVRIGDDAVTFTRAQEHFARGEFFNLSEDAKLTTPSFERFDAGIQIGTDRFTAPSSISFDPEYETVYLEQPDVVEIGLISNVLILDHVRMGAAARTTAALDERLVGAERLEIKVIDAPHRIADAGTLTTIAGDGEAGGTNYSVAAQQAEHIPGAVVVEAAEIVGVS
jgi:hypothetical protein